MYSITFSWKKNMKKRACYTEKNERIAFFRKIQLFGYVKVEFFFKYLKCECAFYSYVQI